MSQFVVTGASMVCSFGSAPAQLIGSNALGVQFGGKPVCVLSDAAPMTNIPTFGVCSSLANPQVAAATAAALGVLTPQPCIPSTGSWLPSGSAVTASGTPCLTQDCKCMCMYAGQISITNPGQWIVSSK